MTPITFMVTVKNEEPRIRYILDVATKWADEVIVIDKGSTDHTVELCGLYPGVRVIRDIEHTRYGDEDRENWPYWSHNDWIYVGTPSEIPTRKLIDKCREMVESDYDLITVPRKMYMLGIHSENSPWYIANYKFLINRARTNVSNRIHQNFTARNGNEGHIPYSDDCCVYHLTYTSCKYWMNTMADYWQMEAEGSTDPTADIKRCMDAIRIHEKRFINGVINGNSELYLLYLAWNLYQFGTAFFLEERRRGMDITATYKVIYDRILREWK